MLLPHLSAASAVCAWSSAGPVQCKSMTMIRVTSATQYTALAPMPSSYSLLVSRSRLTTPNLSLNRFVRLHAAPVQVQLRWVVFVATITHARHLRSRQAGEDGCRARF